MQDQIELYLETNGIRGEMIKRAKEQRQRLSEYLDNLLYVPFFQIG